MYTNEVTKKQWPRWMVSPAGDRAVVHCAGDIPPEWKLEVPLPSAPVQIAEPSRDAEVAALKARIAELEEKKAKKAA